MGQADGLIAFDFEFDVVGIEILSGGLVTQNVSGSLLDVEQVKTC